MKEIIIREMVIKEMVMIGASDFHVRWVKMGYEMGSGTGSIMVKKFAKRLAIKAGQTE